MQTIIGFCASITGFCAWKLASIIDNFKAKPIRFISLLAFAWIDVGLIFGGATLAMAAFDNFASQKRLAKVIGFYGITEDMCQALKKGMSEADVLNIMGRPDIDDPISPLYCPKSHQCRSLTYDSQRKVTEIECWDGSER